ncbi:methylglyoxal synthase [Streptomyces sp. cg36]|uniref:methylglyoxal synthase n=1 Tax=Streptomyces sp. cg36 TaxID=3238798 RepID=UPI0034E25C7F
MPIHGGPSKTRSGAAIALVAHDAKKAELISWAGRHQDVLKRCRLVATRTTGAQLAAEVRLAADCVESGPLGGDQQIGAMIVEGKIAMVVFFTDPLSAHAHDCDVRALLRLAVVHNVPIAPNPASADLLLSDLVHDVHGTGPAKLDVA